MSQNKLFYRADSACAETRRLIAAKAAAFAVKGRSRSKAVAPCGVDRLSIARQHIAEAQHHIAIQLMLVAKLDRHGHAKLAGSARDLLIILESTLRLARQHLARVEDETMLEYTGPLFDPPPRKIEPAWRSGPGGPSSTGAHRDDAQCAIATGPQAATGRGIPPLSPAR